MNRSVLIRGMVLLTSSACLLIGCGESTPTEGELPKTKVASPEDLENLQKKLLQEKVATGAQYKAPPGIQKPVK